MAKISHPWDTLMKLLMRKEAQALASLALLGVQVGNALDKELKVRDIEGDFFFEAYLDDLAIILHFEFQKRKTIGWIGGCGSITRPRILWRASPSIPFSSI